MNPFKLAKDIFVKKTDIATNDDVDSQLPFKAKIGSLITLNISPFLRAQGTLVSIPEKTHTITAISKLHLPLSGTLYRYYLTKGDDPSSVETFIQIYSNSSGDIEEMQYYQRMLRMYPETPDDYNLFTGANGEGLGFKEFSLWREQMSGIGYNEDTLNESFGEEDELVFSRQINGNDFIAPFKAQEKRIDDSRGENGLKQDVLFMPYVRDVGEQKEFLLICTETLLEQNHKYDNEVRVDFMIGLSLGDTDIKIQ